MNKVFYYILLLHYNAYCEAFTFSLIKKYIIFPRVEFLTLLNFATFLYVTFAYCFDILHFLNKIYLFFPFFPLFKTKY